MTDDDDQQRQRDLETAHEVVALMDSDQYATDQASAIADAIAAAREQGIAQGRADGLREAVALIDKAPLVHSADEPVGRLVELLAAADLRTKILALADLAKEVRDEIADA